MKTIRVFSPTFTAGQQRAVDVLTGLLKHDIGSADLNIKPRLPDVRFHIYADNYDGIYPFCTLTTDNRNWDTRIVILLTIPLRADTMEDREQYSNEMLEQGIAVITMEDHTVRLFGQVVRIPAFTTGRVTIRSGKFTVYVNFGDAEIVMPINIVHMIEGGTLALDESQ